MNPFDKLREIAFALLRVVSGFMFSFHGSQKILGILAVMPRPRAGTQMWWGGIIELIAGLMILLGVEARWAALLASGEMAIAYFQFHWKFQMGAMMLPGVNQGELAVLYCFVFFFIACHGGGKWSVGK